jgi:hypothetical protein
MANICHGLRNFFFSPVLKSPTHIGFIDVKKMGRKSHTWAPLNVVGTSTIRLSRLCRKSRVTQAERYAAFSLVNKAARRTLTYLDVNSKKGGGRLAAKTDASRSPEFSFLPSRATMSKNPIIPQSCKYLSSYYVVG